MKQIKRKAAKKDKDTQVTEATPSITDDRKNHGRTDLEYQVKLYFTYDKVRGLQNYVVELRTFRLFSNLNYSISTKMKKTKENIDIKITGLSTNNSFYSNSNAAISYLLFEDLYGKFNLRIIKQDGSVNSAEVTFNIYEKQIQLGEISFGTGDQKREFCQFIVDESLFSFE